jgi:hypothetical protein
VHVLKERALCGNTPAEVTHMNWYWEDSRGVHHPFDPIDDAYPFDGFLAEACERVITACWLAEDGAQIPFLAAE